MTVMTNEMYSASGQIVAIERRLSETYRVEYAMVWLLNLLSRYPYAMEAAVIIACLAFVIVAGVTSLVAKRYS